MQHLEEMKEIFENETKKHKTVYRKFNKYLLFGF